MSRSRRPWLVAGALLLVAILLAVGMGAVAGGRWQQERVIGTSRVGEWADLSAYGFRLRVDGVAVSDELPGIGGAPVRGIDGLRLARVQLTLEPTRSIAADNYADILSCDVAVRNGRDEQIGPSAVGLQLPDGSVGGCTAVVRPIEAGRQYALTQVYEIRPSDEAGLSVEVVVTEGQRPVSRSWRFTT
ncbi:hypothetical protein [Granulicoccus phenolivorans]|uniref:hypothetical protein n=1 Tax=Granulicoccus phenolivorans TaxID=266854 RepID=UPI00047EA5F6|nr:hypothetical protein [Granulicoccus phenolivorans]